MAEDGNPSLSAVPVIVTQSPSDTAHCRSWKTRNYMLFRRCVPKLYLSRQPT